MMKKVDFSLEMCKEIVIGEAERTQKSGSFFAFKGDDLSLSQVTANDGVPYIEEPEQELKPFDRVIAKKQSYDYDNYGWEHALYSHEYNGKFVASAKRYDEVHPWRDCYARYLGTDTPWDQILKETEGEK